MAQARLRPITFGYRPHLWKVDPAARIILDMVADHLDNYATFPRLRPSLLRELGGYCEGALRAVLASPTINGADWSRIDRVRRDLDMLFFGRGEELDGLMRADFMMQLAGMLADAAKPRAECRRLVWWRSRMPHLPSILPDELTRLDQ